MVLSEAQLQHPKGETMHTKQGVIKINSENNTFEHIEAETKWTPFASEFSWMIDKFAQDFTEICY